MKKILLTLAIGLAFVSCSNNYDDLYDMIYDLGSRVTNLKHIGIVPASDTGILSQTHVKLIY